MKYIIPMLLMCSAAAGQSTQVPHKLEFAGMTLSIRDDARREIQKDVDALTQSPRHFMIKVERARTYFPIIEKVFAEERLPDDFKYLVLQESALIPDAVSVSNAVGFWQFKDFTAVEVGLRVDKEVDERMNIVSSSRGAARYLKKNNYFFNNWLFALQAYQMGAGGVMQAVKDYQSGATHMEITSKTYWYVKKFLAHKIAFEGAVSGAGKIQVKAVDSNGEKSLASFASQYGVDETELVNYNKWVRKGRIPDDKSYAVLIPFDGPDGGMVFEQPVAAAPSSAEETAARQAADASADKRPERIKINGVQAIRAKAGENVASLARRAGIPSSRLLKYNDMNARRKLVAGEYYFTARKRSRSEKAFHKLGSGEDLWTVSQQYGVKLKKLRRFNRLQENERAREGTMLYLASRRPKEDNSPMPADVLEVDKGAVFAWTASPQAPVATVPVEPQKTVDNSRAAAAQEVVPNVVPPREQPETTVSAPPQSGEQRAPLPTSTDRPRGEPAVTPVQTNEMHTVQAGETLYAIAKEYGVSVMDLGEWNSLDINEPIRQGQTLQLKAPAHSETSTAMAPSPSDGQVHEVKASETLYSVARKYGVTIKEIMEWNNKTDFNIHVGEKLRVSR